MLPNFFIVGAPKAGTTSLYHYLNGHPDIFMSDPKELNYFSGSEIKSQGLYYNTYIVKDLDKYEKHFKNSTGETAAGEASVSYLFYKEVPEKIYELIPDAKIIIILRDPVKRAHSHFLMDERLGYINYSFEDIVYSKKKIAEYELFYQQYVELGFYHDQVKRYLDTFGKNRVRVYFFDEFNKNPGFVLKDLYQFLGVKEHSGSIVSEKYNVGLTPGTKLTGELYKSERLRKSLSKIVPDSIKKKLKKVLFSASG
ncbi:MAG: sulfotransferase, partial [Candidatus Aminicenantes bacterium]|nr:sulfotransferase [Candidatus Aminicenantes bacterium]